jgi:hypothetical protein
MTKPYLIYDFEGQLGGTQLSGGAEIDAGMVETIDLHLNHWVKFPRPGKYAVTAVAHIFPAKGRPAATRVRSNSVIVIVKP